MAKSPGGGGGEGPTTPGLTPHSRTEGVAEQVFSAPFGNAPERLPGGESRDVSPPRPKGGGVSGRRR